MDVPRSGTESGCSRSLCAWSKNKKRFSSPRFRSVARESRPGGRLGGPTRSFHVDATMMTRCNSNGGAHKGGREGSSPAPERFLSSSCPFLQDSDERSVAADERGENRKRYSPRRRLWLRHVSHARGRCAAARAHAHGTSKTRQPTRRRQAMQARRVYVRACSERSRSAAVSPTSAPAPANAALPRGFKSRSAPVGVPQFARSLGSSVCAPRSPPHAPEVQRIGPAPRSAAVGVATRGGGENTCHSAMEGKH